jgi:hypothetical protein
LKGRKVLSREEIEGELRDVFAKMSPVELARELDGAWRELVEEELANRLEASQLEASRLAANLIETSRLEASQLEEDLREASRPVESLMQALPDDECVALIDAAPSPPPLKANWRSRIAAVWRAILKKMPH